MTLKVFHSPVHVTQDIFYTNKNQTVVIASMIEAENQAITITAENVIVLAHARITARELNVTCSGKFVTIGLIDANRQNIDSLEVFYGGPTTTFEQEIHVEAAAYPCFIPERAREEIGRILKLHFPPQPSFTNCRLEAMRV